MSRNRLIFKNPPLFDLDPRFETLCRSKLFNIHIHITYFTRRQETFDQQVKSQQEGNDIKDPDETHPCLPNHQFAQQVETGKPTKTTKFMHDIFIAMNC